MNKSLRILFISNDASRTGAPILLLKLISWLKKYKSIEPTILMINGGPLLSEFKELGKCDLWNDPRVQHSIINRVLNKLFKKKSLYKNQKQIIRNLKTRSFNVVYLNTVLSLNLLAEFNFQNSKPITVLHVHELNTVIRKYKLENKLIESRIDKYIAVSDLVRDNLITNYNININQIHKVPEYIDLNEWTEISNSKDLTNSFIVAGIGQVHWRKGVEFFILMANQVIKQHKSDNFEFWWIGAINENDYQYYYDDLVKLGLHNKFRFLKEQKDLNSIYSKINLLAITSREDPYPTIALEAGIHSIPFVCWNQGIGTVELVKKGCGLSVDYFDINAMAEAVMKLKEDSNLLKELGMQAKIEAEKHDINIASEKIYNIINKS